MGAATTLAVAPGQTDGIEQLPLVQRLREDVVAAAIQYLHPQPVIGMGSGYHQGRGRVEGQGVIEKLFPRAVRQDGFADQDYGRAFAQDGGGLGDGIRLQEGPAAVTQDAAQFLHGPLGAHRQYDHRFAGGTGLQDCRRLQG